MQAYRNEWRQAEMPIAQAVRDSGKQTAKSRIEIIRNEISVDCVLLLYTFSWLHLHYDLQTECIPQRLISTTSCCAVLKVKFNLDQARSSVKWLIVGEELHL
jgi:hypothetical protein